MYVCNCFGVTEAQVHACKAAGADSPREVASACKAGTDCGSCVRRIQALLGRPADRPARREPVSFSAALLTAPNGSAEVRQSLQHAG